MKIKAVIIDDIPSYIDTLCMMLSQYSEIQIVATATNKEEGIYLLKKHSPDLIFLDIELQDKTGFEILDECPNYYRYVVFTTSFEDYAIQSYNYRGLHYLLKPIDPNSLQIAIDKARTSFSDVYNLEDVRNCVFKVFNFNTQKIFIPDKNVHHAIELDSIIYIQSSASYSNIYTIDKHFKASRNLNYMNRILENQPQFIRVHRSYLVNINHIQNLKRGMSSTLQMTNNYLVPISNAEKSSLFTRLGIKE